MIKIIKNREPEVIREYTLEFRWKADSDAGFSFPAKTNELPDFEKMTPEAKANYERCLTDERILGPEFEVREWTYINPAVGKCSCGTEVILDGGYEGAVQCECGRWYNIYGQELRDPKYWEEDDSDADWEDYLDGIL